MLQDALTTQGKDQLVVQGRTYRIRPAVVRSYNVDLLEIDRLSLVSRLRFFSAEYIWGNLLLVAVLCLNAARPATERTEIGLFMNAILKRTIDIIGALVGLILTAPLFAILPLLIKFDSRGPVFYQQSRVGHNRRKRDRRQEDVSMLGRAPRDRRRDDLMGRPFSVIKFRTMVADAETNSGPVWATQNDPRITKLGAFMRKTRMDEIPQFVNILFGQMSLVGPRPERPKFVKELSEQVADYEKRLDVKPGLTGLAQIENGYDSSVASVVRKVHYDLEYIRTFSVWQDVKIMLRTVVVVVTGKGAF